MSEKRKRIDLDQVRNMIEADKEARQQRRIDNGEKIARRVIQCIVDGNLKVDDGVIEVKFHIWQRDIWAYDDDTVSAILKANGLQLADEDRPYRMRHMEWNDSFPLPGVNFNIKVQLWHEPPEDELSKALREAEEYFDELDTKDGTS